ncbi:MAG: ankyrin repeat domain-containing protein [Aquisalinus sp.]|nr:ankyrin repeat domain-containing protein [Aquisalinus sp.]
MSAARSGNGSRICAAAFHAAAHSGMTRVGFWDSLHTQLHRESFVKSVLKIILAALLLVVPACAQSIYTYRFSEKQASDFFTDGNAAQLADAACSGDRSGVREQVRAGVNPNAVGRENMTPLGWALVCRNLSGVRALLDAGADPNQIVFADNYSLKIAISLRNVSFLETLLVQGADPNYNYAMAFGAARESVSLKKETGSWTHFDLLMQYGLHLDLLSPSSGEERFNSTIFIRLTGSNEFCKALTFIRNERRRNEERILRSTIRARINPASPEYQCQQEMIDILMERVGEENYKAFEAELLDRNSGRN